MPGQRPVVARRVPVRGQNPNPAAWNVYARTQNRAALSCYSTPPLPTAARASRMSASTCDRTPTATVSSPSQSRDPLRGPRCAPKTAAGRAEAFDCARDLRERIGHVVPQRAPVELALARTPEPSHALRPAVMRRPTCASRNRERVFVVSALGRCKAGDTAVLDHHHRPRHDARQRELDAVGRMQKRESPLAKARIVARRPIERAGPLVPRASRPSSGAPRVARSRTRHPRSWQYQPRIPPSPATRTTQSARIPELEHRAESRCAADRRSQMRSHRSE